MRALIGNMVKTEVADYPCASREEAEALYIALRSAHPARAAADAAPPARREETQERGQRR